MRIDVAALFDPGGPYRCVNGVNTAAILAVAVGVGVYYTLPHELLKVVWGVGVGALAYLVLSRAQEALGSTRATAAPSATSERSGAASQH